MTGEIKSFNRESGRSTESSKEYHVKHNPSTVANSSIKKYLQQHNQIQEFTKSQHIPSTSQTHSYQQNHELDENRLVIEEEDEAEKVANVVEYDMETDEATTKLVILGSGKDQKHQATQHLTNLTTTNDGGTLDLSKGRDNSDTAASDKTTLSLCASILPVSSTSDRLSNNNTIQFSTFPKHTLSPSLSSTVTPALSSIMTIVPYSQASTIGALPIPISNNSNDNLNAVESSISQNINLHGGSVEGKIKVYIIR